MEGSHPKLSRRPFPNTPDSESYYPASGHETALAGLLEAIHQEEGILLVTGAPGTGKTLLCHCLLERFGEEVASAFLTNSHIPDRASLLQAILYEYSLPHVGLSEQALRLSLTDYLLKNFSTGRRALVVVDEAQYLGTEVLEELRLLGNLEAKQGKAVQVVLVGQPELLKTLQRSELQVLAQRLMVRLHLDPLPLQEAADYLLHQLRIAGARPEEWLTDEALEMLAKATRGVPRLLNQAARQALAMAEKAGALPVDAEAALEALSLLGLHADLPGDSMEIYVSTDAMPEGDGESQGPDEDTPETLSLPSVGDDRSVPIASVHP
jgi:type II secretory pathway predicted ATPase ExeA